MQFAEFLEVRFAEEQPSEKSLYIEDSDRFHCNGWPVSYRVLGKMAVDPKAIVYISPTQRHSAFSLDVIENERTRYNAEIVKLKSELVGPHSQGAKTISAIATPVAKIKLPQMNVPPAMLEFVELWLTDQRFSNQKQMEKVYAAGTYENAIARIKETTPENGAK